MIASNIQIFKEKKDLLIGFNIHFPNESIKIYQIFNEKFSIAIKMVYISGNTYIIFIDSKYFEIYKKKQREISKLFGCSYHIRICCYTNSLSELILTWFWPLREHLQINIRIDEFDKNCMIFLRIPSNLRQFIIGKGGHEIKLFEKFLNSSVKGNFKFNIKIGNKW